MRRATALLLALALALPLGGLGRFGVPSARAAGDDEEDESGRLSVAVFLLYEGTVAPGPQAELARGLERALKKNKKLSIKDKDLLLAEFGGEVPSDAINEARALAQSGAELLAQNRPKDAAEKLAAAEAALENVLAFVKKNELADVQFQLGVAWVQASDKKKARAAFVRLQVWRPTWVLDTGRYGNLLPIWEDARKEIGKAGRGSLEVISEPEGAMAFVDGKYVGVTPTAADALPIGDHYVTLKLEGYQRKVIKAKVDSKYQELVTESLPKSEKYLLVEQSLGRVRGALGAERADVSMLDLRTFLFIDQAVFVRVTPLKRGAFKLDAYLYDLRAKRRLSQVLGGKVKSAEPDPLGDALDEVATALYTGVRYDGRSDADLVAKRRKPKRGGGGGGTPFYGRWWFWTGIAVVGAAVASPYVYDGLTGPTPASCPDGHTCGEVLLNF